MLSSLDEYITGTGQRILVHRKDQCRGEFCVIHNPSDHPMKDFPTNWRADIQLMERMCPHGVGHPDPDCVEYQQSMWYNGMNWTKEQIVSYLSVHGCDGCCQKVNT